ncbi:flagellar biosynthetic protein FliR [Heliorestis acidaminivorans]|uniref:Flagellar biosynthetic protein FliR n=1 Tax=Heliorestis acidaminivorans TaxID=553427 RepID=A0A6I0EVG4_9FIRM|nr:flagellar biosynthetic protein FliR [Heliorestis acidaminivorans]KAB2954384.1 flagellar biosynthetic protein FliR [Heliorestis acidaminivorans]
METVISQFLVHLDILLMMMTRVAGILVMAPLFNTPGFNNYAKIGFAFFVALTLFLAMPASSYPEVPTDLFHFTVTITQEVVIGLTIGFIFQLLFAAIMTAGQFIDYQLGFGIINVADPLWGTQVPMTGLFLQMIGLLFFVLADGHLLIIQVLADSFRLIPVGTGPFTAELSGSIAAYIVHLFVSTFLIALQLALPILGVTIITDVALGIMARTVPQLNIFVVGLPLKIGVGIFFLWVLIPFYIESLNYLFAITLSNVEGFLSIIVRQ